MDASLIVPVVVAFLLGAALMMLGLTLRPPLLIRRLAAAWIPVTSSTLHAVALILVVGAGILALGFWQGLRYGSPFTCTDVSRLTEAFVNTDLALQRFARITTDLSDELVPRAAAWERRRLAPQRVRTISLPPTKGAPLSHDSLPVVSLPRPRP